MKKFSLAIGLVIIYTMLYILNQRMTHTVDGTVGFYLPMLPFLLLPPAMSILFFDRKRYAMSFFASGGLVFAILFFIGIDGSNLWGNLNGILGLFYVILGAIFILSGTVSSLIGIIMNKYQGTR